MTEPQTTTASTLPFPTTFDTVPRWISIPLSRAASSITSTTPGAGAACCQHEIMRRTLIPKLHSLSATSSPRYPSPATTASSMEGQVRPSSSYFSAPSKMNTPGFRAPSNETGLNRLPVATIKESNRSLTPLGRVTKLCPAPLTSAVSTFMDDFLAPLKSPPLAGDWEINSGQDFQGGSWSVFRSTIVTSAPRRPASKAASPPAEPPPMTQILTNGGIAQ